MGEAMKKLLILFALLSISSAYANDIPDQEVIELSEKADAPDAQQAEQIRPKKCPPHFMTQLAKVIGSGLLTAGGVLSLKMMYDLYQSDREALKAVSKSNSRSISHDARNIFAFTAAGYLTLLSGYYMIKRAKKLVLRNNS